MSEQTGEAQDAQDDLGDFNGLKISDLLAHLPLRKTPPTGHQPLDSLPGWDCLSICPVVLQNASSVHGNVRSQSLLPDSIQRLSGPQDRRCLHQTHPYKTPVPNPALHTSNPAQGCTPAALSCAPNETPCSLSPDSFFLPYLTARQTELGCDSLSSIRKLLLKGELCPDVGGVCGRSQQRPTEPWRREPVQRRCGQPGLPGQNGQYFEDIRHLQWLLYKRVVCPLPGCHSVQRPRGALFRSLRRAVTSPPLPCWPPLLCSTDINYSAVSQPR